MTPAARVWAARRWIAGDAELKAAECDRCAPEDFYSTTNQRTLVRHNGQWLEVANQRMDAMIVVTRWRALPALARCESRRSDRGWDEGYPRRAGSERARPFGVCVHEQRYLVRAPGGDGRRSKRLPSMRQVRRRRQENCRGGRPGGGAHGRRERFPQLDPRWLDRCGAGGKRAGGARYRSRRYSVLRWVSVRRDGRLEEHGHRNHMRAINAINRAGGIKEAVEKGRASQRRDV